MERILLKPYLYHFPSIIAQVILEYVPCDVIIVSTTNFIWCLYYDPEPTWKKIPNRFRHSLIGYTFNHHMHQICVGLDHHINLITGEFTTSYHDYEIETHHIMCNHQLYKVGARNHWMVNRVQAQLIQRFDDTRYEFCYVLVCFMTPRVRFACAVLNNKIYISGGREKKEVGMGIVEVYNPDLRTCTRIASLTQPRFGHTMFGFRGKLYVVSGYVIGYTPLKCTEMYDLLLNRWIPADINFPFPEKTQYMVLDDVLYAYYSYGHIFSYYHDVYAWVPLPFPPLQEHYVNHINESYIM